MAQDVILSCKKHEYIVWWCNNVFVITKERSDCSNLLRSVMQEIATSD